MTLEYKNKQKMAAGIMEKDWVKLSEAGIQCAVSCFYLTVGKLEMKSGMPNQAVPSSLR